MNVKLPGPQYLASYKSDIDVIQPLVDFKDISALAEQRTKKFSITTIVRVFFILVKSLTDFCS